jgi:hypothetical protein
MPQRKSFLLRIDPAVLDAVQRWANDDLRSLNGQIEFLLRKSLADAGRAHPRESVATDSMPARDDDRRGATPQT